MEQEVTQARETLEPTLSTTLVLSAQDQRVEEEVTAAAEAPDDMSRVLERRKLETVFRLWAERRGEGGRVERKDLARALNR